MVEAKNVSIRYLAGDFTDIGLKEWIIKKIKHENKVENIWAVNDVSFKLEQGDFMGIIGVNGSGKSTLLKSVTGILPPKKGEIVAEGNIVALLELGTGFDGDLNLRENILMRGALLGYSKEFIEERTDEILEFAELTKFQWYKYKQLSSGMRSRLAFSICCMVNPDVLILDEVLSVGDGSFRKKSGDKMLDVIHSGAITLFVGHNTSTMKRLANKILWLDHGKQIAFAETRKDALKLLKKYDAFLKIRASNPDYVIDLDALNESVNKDMSMKISKKSSIDEIEVVKKNFQKKEMRYKVYLKFLRELILYPEKQIKMKEYIKNNNISHIAIYGENTILKTIVPLLEKEKVKIDYIIENLKTSDYCEKVYPRTLEKFPETQMILIADMIFTERIHNKLLNLTNIPNISLNELFS